ncbi:MAG TPA: AraC family transcriptional regulator [Bacteroidetes bacterium]|nr:AraC family transcriptional regulator [Bacteroidota bacterium]
MEKTKPQRPTETFLVKNMVCRCCIWYLNEKLTHQGYHITGIELGKVTVSMDSSRYTREDIEKSIEKLGFELIRNREKWLVEQIKRAVIELIHQMNNVDSITRKSDYIVEKLGLSYPYLSRLFSANEPVTLERYIILQKIERIKELVNQGEFSLSEIAYMMDYSSVQYLSRQFHAVTGVTVSEYKQGKGASRKPIDQLY